MSKLTDLIERKNSLIANATQMVQAGLKTSEAKEQYRKILADVDDADEMISMLKRVEPFLNVPAPVVPVAATRDRRESKKQRKANLSNAYRHYLRHGSQPGAPEQRALLTSSGSAGALIPQEFDSVVYDALKYWGPIATMVTHRNDNNRPQKFTVSDDASATMSYISESGDSTATAADPTLVSYVPATDALVTTVKYSMQMLEDANSFESFIRDIAGLRCARSIEYCLTIGKDNGTNTALPNSPVGGLLGSVSTGATTSTLAAGIGYSDLSNLAASVDHAYYVNGSFMASPSVFQYLLGQKDSTSRPFYNIDPDTGLLMINGKKLIVNAAMLLLVLWFSSVISVARTRMWVQASRFKFCVNATSIRSREQPLFIIGWVLQRSLAVL